MKKIARVTLVVTLVFLLFSPVAFASDSDLEKVIDQVEKTNLKIDKKIDKAIEKAEKFEDTKNEDKLIDKVIDNLIDWTNKEADKMIDKAAKKDIEIYCELVEVEIGGQIILIDPLRIAGY